MTEAHLPELAPPSHQSAAAAGGSPGVCGAVQELVRFEAPPLVDEPGADLEVRAWRFSYNARGIIEMPNHLVAARTAIIFVHPWGIDDGQGWRTPEPAGAADFARGKESSRGAAYTGSDRAVHPQTGRSREARAPLAARRGRSDPA